MSYDGLTATKTFCPFEGQTHAICVLCYLCIDHQRVRYCDTGWSLNSYCHSFIYQYMILLLFVCGASLSLAAEVMCISVFPGVLDEFSNDPHTGTTNDFNSCLYRLSVPVGKCSIARP